jgi:hypothetical protein
LCIYTIFSWSSSVIVHLGYSQILVIVNSAAINISVQVEILCPQTYSSRYIPRSHIAGSLVVLFLVFLGTTVLLSIMITLIYIPTNILEMWIITVNKCFHCCIYSIQFCFLNNNTTYPNFTKLPVHMHIHPMSWLLKDQWKIFLNFRRNQNLEIMS